MTTTFAIQKVKAAHDGTQVNEVEVPTLQPDEVLIRVMGAAICGSDLHLYKWDESVRGKLLRSSDNFAHGVTMGHEFCGEVVQLGSAVNQAGTHQYGPIKLGDFVSAESHVVCNRCYQCRLNEKHVCVDDRIIGFDRDGAFSGFIALPASCVWVNDKNLPFELAAVQEPLGNAMHAAASFDLKGAAVAIFGCGPIGLFAAAIAKAHGARRVIAVDVNEYRLSLAAKLGAETVLQDLKAERVAENQRVTALVRDLGGNDGPDVSLEMSGSADALNNAIQASRRGGKVVLFGIPSASDVTIQNYSTNVIFKGVTLHAVIGRRIYQTWEQVRDLLGSEENRAMIRSVVSGVLPWQDYQHGFSEMIAGKASKYVLDFRNA